VAERLLALLVDEHGQDLTEYALLLAFVVVGSAAIFTVSVDDMRGIWNSVDNRLAAANRAASPLRP